MSFTLSPHLRHHLQRSKQYNLLTRQKILPSSFSSIRFFSTNQTQQQQQQKEEHYDILIIGGGVAGSTLTKLLQSSVKTHPLRVGLLEFRPPPPSSVYFDKNNEKDVPPPMARAYALSPQSLHLINGDNDSGSVMERLKDRVGTYEHMQVWESDGPATLHFHHSDLEHVTNSNITNQNILGAVVEDGPLVSTLWENIKQKNENSKVQVEMIAPAAVKSIKAPPVTSTFPPPPVTVTYEQTTTSSSSSNNNETQTNQYEITTDLLVAADGGNSFVRRSLGMPTIQFGYNRRAVTCTVEVDRSMHKTAYQRFMPNGPIALLPIWNEDNSENDNKKFYANIVWSTTPSEATQFQNMTNEQFLQKLNNELQKGPTNNPPLLPHSITSAMPKPLANLTYGIEMLAQSLNNGITMSTWSERKQPFHVPPLITGIVGRKFGFDLNLMQAQSYVQPRVVLVGDAAHTIHPMAGQGLNLGISDVECLARIYNEAIASGMEDVGGGSMHFLDKYDQERRVEVSVVMGGIQALHGFFSSTFEPLVYVRSLGMNVVNSVGFVRKRLVEVAVGATGITTKRMVEKEGKGLRQS